MAKNQSFPIPGCSSCPHYEVVGGLTRYCSGFKRRKPKRFKSSDPRLKVPKCVPDEFHRLSIVSTALRMTAVSIWS